MFTVRLIRVDMVVILARMYAVLTLEIDTMVQAKITCILLKDWVIIFKQLLKQSLTGKNYVLGQEVGSTS